MNRIAELRRERGLTQIQLSKALGISQSSLSGYENGKFEPDQEMLLSMAKYFDVSVDYLLCRTSQKKVGSNLSRLSLLISRNYLN